MSMDNNYETPELIELGVLSTETLSATGDGRRLQIDENSDE